MDVMELLTSTLIQGLIYALISYGVYITYSILDFPDLGVDGTFPLGAAVTAVLMTKGVDPWLTLPASPDSGRSGGTFHRSGPREAEGAEPAGGHHHHDRPVLCEPADRRVQPDHRPGYGHHLHLCPGDGPVWGSLPLRAEADCVPGAGHRHQAAAGRLFPHEVRPAAAGCGRQRHPGDHLGQGPRHSKDPGAGDLQRPGGLRRLHRLPRNPQLLRHHGYRPAGVRPGGGDYRCVHHTLLHRHPAGPGLRNSGPSASWVPPGHHGGSAGQCALQAVHPGSHEPGTAHQYDEADYGCTVPAGAGAVRPEGEAIIHA